MLKKSLSILILLLITTSIGLCEPPRAADATVAPPAPSVQITAAQQEENAVLDLVMDSLLHSKELDTSLKGRKLLFNHAAWPTYKSQHSFVILGDLSLVEKQKEAAFQKLEADPSLSPRSRGYRRILGLHDFWRTAFEGLYPDCKVYVASCTLSHASPVPASKQSESLPVSPSEGFHVLLRFGPSEHGAVAEYTLRKERAVWKIIQSRLVYWM